MQKMCSILVCECIIICSRLTNVGVH
uniref:Uncharacterized protein n=1 Tax=Anguilla anguilla TaxID=7936 RepID=A0A0E9XII3_ANGAN